MIRVASRFTLRGDHRDASLATLGTTRHARETLKLTVAIVATANLAGPPELTPRRDSTSARRSDCRAEHYWGQPTFLQFF